MKTSFDIENLIHNGVIRNELDYERAMNAEKKLRLLAKDSSHYKKLRAKLRDILEKYEEKGWSDADAVDDAKIQESDKAEKIVEKEEAFVTRRKNIIKARLKKMNITQQELGYILGHKSKTHMSELMNGVTPFKLKDLIIINALLSIDFADLIPTFLSEKDIEKVQKAISDLNKPTIKFTNKNVAFL